MAKLGELCGYVESTISGWETGRSRPNLDALRTLGAALGKKAAYFFGEEGDSPPPTPEEAESRLRQVLAEYGLTEQKEAPRRPVVPGDERLEAAFDEIRQWPPGKKAQLMQFIDFLNSPKSPP